MPELDGEDADWKSGAAYQCQALARSSSHLRTRRWPRGSMYALLILLLIFAPAACSGVPIERQFNTSVSTGTHTVPLQILEGFGGSTTALLPVYIEGQGPFLFALDTGASQSLVDLDVVRQLNLPILGEAAPAAGVGGLVSAQLIRINEWRTGDVELSPGIFVTIDLPEPRGREGLQGLLGSDILSDFNVITIDYQREILILGPQTMSPSPSSSPAPATGTER